MRIFCAGAIALALLASTAADAGDSNICLSLEAQLAQLSRGPTPGQDPYQYDRPIAQQQSQLDRATEEARSAGCMGGFLFFRPHPEARCGQLMATIDRMQANLERLEQTRAQFGGDSFALGQQRNDLLRQLDYYRCGANRQSPGQDSGGGFLREIFGGSIFEQPDNSASAYGTYRTLCVRTCDGFYFPISFSTVPGQFSTDAATCQAMCPGSEVDLYTYRNPGEDVSQMVSVSGQPYTALPTAFKFRTSFDKSCTCHATATAAPPVFTQFPTDDSGLTTVYPPSLDAMAAPVVPPGPNLRPVDAGEDPATLADRAGGLVPGPVSKVTATAATAADEPRKVRIVGPNYYYGQQN